MARLREVAGGCTLRRSRAAYSASSAYPTRIQASCRCESPRWQEPRLNGRLGRLLLAREPAEDGAYKGGADIRPELTDALQLRGVRRPPAKARAVVGSGKH